MLICSPNSSYLLIYNSDISNVRERDSFTGADWEIVPLDCDATLSYLNVLIIEVDRSRQVHEYS